MKISKNTEIWTNIEKPVYCLKSKSTKRHAQTGLLTLADACVHKCQMTWIFAGTHFTNPEHLLGL